MAKTRLRKSLDPMRRNFVDPRCRLEPDAPALDAARTLAVIIAFPIRLRAGLPVHASSWQSGQLPLNWL